MLNKLTDYTEEYVAQLQSRSLRLPDDGRNRVYFDVVGIEFSFDLC